MCMLGEEGLDAVASSDEEPEEEAGGGAGHTQDVTVRARRCLGVRQGSAAQRAGLGAGGAAEACPPPQPAAPLRRRPPGAPSAPTPASARSGRLSRMYVLA